MRALILANFDNSNNVRILIKECCRQLAGDETNFISYDLPLDEIEKSINASKNEYDIIYAFSNFNVLEKMKPLSSYGLPVILDSGDYWGRLIDDRFRNLVEYHKPNGIVIENRCTFPIFREYLRNKDIQFFWLTYGIDPTIMMDYGEEKTVDVGMTGKLSNYEFRRSMDNLLSMQSKIKYKRYIKESNVSYEEYARNINRNYITLGGGWPSRTKPYYHLGNNWGKNFEICGCKSCLCNPNWGDAETLGFKDGENCILYKRESQGIEKIKYYLNHKDELERITENGYKLVHKHHTIERHVYYFKRDLELTYE